MCTGSLSDSHEEICRLQKRVTELQTQEKELQSKLQDLSIKEEYYYALFAHNPNFTIIVDKEGRIVKSNKAKLNSGDRLPNIGDIMYKDYASNHEIDMYKELMKCIKSCSTKRYPEMKYREKTLSITISPFPNGAIISYMDITAQKTAETECHALIQHLRSALLEVETLRGLIPICASCKKIRDDSGYWNHMELYISKRTLADFTHTLCPHCLQNYYPDYWEERQKREANEQKSAEPPQSEPQAHTEDTSP